MAKKSISERVSARMQKDLTSFTEKYQTELEKMVGDAARDFSPIWKDVQRRLARGIMALYSDLAKTQDPQKLRSLQYRVKQLRNLEKLIIEQLKATYDHHYEYLTEKIQFSYAKSYYMHAFGLEQAARVSVVVPLLTKAHLLGVIKNAWLGDGHTYSSRLRANTAYLAKKMKDTIHQGVVEGWGVNKTALEIRKQAGEGLYNAVRLARTEYTRAASQGASYAYMENADILDDKRWNATLDRKTAKKDAANDGKTYSLDYDTEANPGRPGERIPNHPNCRCRWSPVLSALGVSDKQRIARDKEGNRIYTKARTYDEYAKERGLPTSAEMKDNEKMYARPTD